MNEVPTPASPGRPSITQLHAVMLTHYSQRVDAISRKIKHHPLVARLHPILKLACFVRPHSGDQARPQVECVISLACLERLSDWRI